MSHFAGLVVRLYLPDSALIAAASSSPTSAEALGRLPGWGGKATRRLVPVLWPSIERARAEPEAQLPRPPAPGDGPPPANRWPDHDPVAAARLARVRSALGGLADEHAFRWQFFTANGSVRRSHALAVGGGSFMTRCELVRRVTWSPPDPPSGAAVAAALRDGGARSWQVQLTAEPIAAALAADAEPDTYP